MSVSGGALSKTAHLLDLETLLGPTVLGGWWLLVPLPVFSKSSLWGLIPL